MVDQWMKRLRYVGRSCGVWLLRRCHGEKPRDDLAREVVDEGWAMVQEHVAYACVEAQGCAGRALIAQGREVLEWAETAGHGVDTPLTPGDLAAMLTAAGRALIDQAVRASQERLGGCGGPDQASDSAT